MGLGMSFIPADAGAGHPFLMHGRVLSYKLRGTMTKSSSSASRAVQVPALSKAALQDGTYQPGGAYHTTHENITGLWGVSPDLNQEYDDWHLTSIDSLQAFREQREDADPDADLKIWQLDGASSSATRGSTGNTASKSFTPSKPGDGLRAFLVDGALQAVHGALLSVKPVRLNGASLTAQQAVIRKQINKLLELGVIEWSHPINKLLELGVINKQPSSVSGVKLTQHLRAKVNGD